MKLTKQRLKEIIREELAREGKRTDMSMPALSDDDYHQGKRTRMSMPALSDDDFEPELPTYEGEPFGEYDLEAENERGRLAAAEALGVDPGDRSLWDKILAAVEKANLFPRTEGLGEPGDTPPRDRFGADDDGYPPERPPPRSWVDGKPPKPPAKEGKVSSHRSEVTYSKEKRGKSKKPEKKAYNKADRAQAKRDLKK